MRLLSRTTSPLLTFTRNLRFFKSKSEQPSKTSESNSVSTKIAPVDSPIETLKTSVPARTLTHLQPFFTPRQVWVENFDTVETSRLGIVDLHPEIFGARPRIDLIHDNIVWQRSYRRIAFAYTPAKHEIGRSTRKPWPQKGTGRARHGTRRSPLFVGGVKIHGPKGPKSFFYMPPHMKRVLGLCCTLSVKVAQDDLHVINNLDIPSKDPQYILDLIKRRNWGPSVLIVDVDDIIPENIALATYPIKHVTLMPVYGLNVYSMLKYDTLVLTLDAVDRIEEKLLKQLYCPIQIPNKIFSSQV